ncbi:MAG TPA: hypothetical protein VFH78_06375 [Candidatus Thermoplasmatota archaeon]|nr:hypothetical protein [Candidatus Thermoplasmatota archaeon]
MTSVSSGTRLTIALATAAVVAALAAPATFAALSGSGNVTDYVQLSVDTGTLDTLTASAASGSGAIVTSGDDAFQISNAASNVDTFLFYGWSNAPYFGASPLQTSIQLRGTTYPISDLLWFRQETVNSAGGLATSQVYSPLVIKSASDVKTVSFTSSGDACSAWGAAPEGAVPSAAGSFTTKYYTAASANDAPSTSDAVHYCIDATNSRLYLNAAASFTGATAIDLYTVSSTTSLRSYQAELVRSDGTGNKYCFFAVNGAGTSATPELRQCQKLPYEMDGVTSARAYVLFDPPTFFPSTNQGGAVTFAVAGVQWNPYSGAAVNTA